jgi:hypothetical protein
MKPILTCCGALALALALATACKRETPIATPPPAPAATKEPAPPPTAPPATSEAPPAAAPAASPMAAVAVTSATLGNAINADKRVSAATDTFKPGDTIFVSVETSGTAGANLTARWTFVADGQATRVNEETQKVAPGGPSVTEFHIRKPDGWPPGDYQVVILVNDEVAVTRKFSVK